MCVSHALHKSQLSLSAAADGDSNSEDCALAFTGRLGGSTISGLSTHVEASAKDHISRFQEWDDILRQLLCSHKTGLRPVSTVLE